MSLAVLWSRLGPNGAQRRPVWWHWAIAGAIGAVLFYLLAVIFPRLSLLWGYSGLKRLLYEDLGLSDSWSSFFALVGSFFYAIVWLPMLQLTLRVVAWKFDARKTMAAFAAWIVVYGHAPLLHAVFGSDVCFNQRTGEPIKWHVIQPGGQIILFDSAGYDQGGVQKRPATQQICRIMEMQKRGIRPREITDDPRSVEFFDKITGQPRVWYYKNSNGSIDLFDSEGTHPAVGEPLAPVTKDLAEQARASAGERQAATERMARMRAEQERQRTVESERMARLETERKAAEAREKARTDLIELFGTASYPNGIVLLGATSRQTDEISSLAVKKLLGILSNTLQNKQVHVDEFRPKVYSAGHFDKLFSGDAALLGEVGLREKMRSALLAAVTATCHPSSAVSELTSCTVAVEVRVLRATGASSLRSVSEVAAGATSEQAVARAAEMVAERHPDILEGI